MAEAQHAKHSYLSTQPHHTGRYMYLDDRRSLLLSLPHQAIAVTTPNVVLDASMTSLVHAKRRRLQVSATIDLSAVSCIML